MLFLHCYTSSQFSLELTPNSDCDLCCVEGKASAGIAGVDSSVGLICTVHCQHPRPLVDLDTWVSGWYQQCPILVPADGGRGKVRRGSRHRALDGEVSPREEGGRR